MSSHPLHHPRARSVAAMAWLALCAAAPAAAAPIDLHWPQIHWPLSPPDLLLIGSGGVLVLALALALMRRPTRAPRNPEGPDLRRWKNPPE
jgi:hypothetical protein